MFILSLAIAAFNLFILPLFIFALRKASLKVVFTFVGFVMVESIFTAAYTVLTFGGAFGPGIFLYFSTCLVVPFSLALLVIYGFIFFRDVDDSLRRSLYVAGGLLIILLQSSPITGHYAIGGYCDQKARQAGSQAIAAIQSYQQEHGAYPPDLETLVPDYLAQVPVSRCFSGLEHQVTFQVQRCSDTTLLTTTSFDGASILRYNFGTGNWSGMSFLDGACSFLK